jgi:hypothetical protein
MRYIIHCRAMLGGVAQRIAGLPVFGIPTAMVLVQQKWCGQFRSAGSFTLGNAKVCTCGSPAGVASGVDACLLMRSHPLNPVWPSRSGSQSTSQDADRGKRVDSISRSCTDQERPIRRKRPAGCWRVFLTDTTYRKNQEYYTTITSRNTLQCGAGRTLDTS